ncbi:unnamed protein product [Sympodiomycopsis kandeliae]
METPPPCGTSASGSLSAPPTRSKRTSIRDRSHSSIPDAKEQNRTSKEEMRLEHRLCADPGELMRSVGLEVPKLGKEADVLQAWAAIKVPEFKGDETAREQQHCCLLNAMVGEMAKWQKNLPLEVGKRHFVSMGVHTLGGGHGTRGSKKPDIVITNQGSTAADLKVEGGAQKAHVLIEGKTPSGTTPEAQCGKYVIGFAVPGSRYTVILGLRGSRFRVFLFTAKAWSQIATFNYLDRDETTLEWLSFILSDRAVDRAFEEKCGAPLDLVTGKAVEEWYENGAPAKEWRRSCPQFLISDGKLGAPLFRSPAMFGSRTMVWEVEGKIISAAGATLEAGTYVLKHSFVRAGRVPNSHHFAQLVAEQRPWAAKAGWFVDSAGICFDDVSLELSSKTGCRVGLVEVTRGQAGQTWHSTASGISLSSLFRAFRDAVRAIYALRPLHHRDISVFNLFLNVAAIGNLQDEEKRMEAVLEWPTGDAVPELVAAPFDYDRSRYGSDPSDLLKRQAVRANEVVDPDNSLDDAVTGTMPFLSRAQESLDAAESGRMHRDLVRVVREQGCHRLWHDVESLCVCTMYSFFVRYEEQCPELSSRIEDWFRSSAVSMISASTWLAGLVRQTVSLASRSVGSQERKEMQAFCKVFDRLQEAFKDTIPAADASVEEELGCQFAEVGPAFWQQVLQVALDAIVTFEKMEKAQEAQDAQEGNVGSAHVAKSSKGKRKASTSAQDDEQEEKKSKTRRILQPSGYNFRPRWDHSSASSVDHND